MTKNNKQGNDWKRRIADRQKSLVRMNANIRNIDIKDQKSSKIIEKNKKLFFGKFEDKVDKKYKDSLLRETFLVEKKDGQLDKMKPGSIYEDIASLLLQARENTGLYVVLSWPEGVDWPYFTQILANKTITHNCRYEDGLKVSFYPSTPRSLNRGKNIRIDKNGLIREAREAAKNNFFSPRYNTYFALNDFDKDEKEGIRQNPSIIESTPFFGLTDDFNWMVSGGGYFKDIYTYMFNFTGNRRRSAIETHANQLNDPVKTKEGVFSIEASISPKQAVVSSLQPIKTDILYIDGRSKILNIACGGSELIGDVMGAWIKNGHLNSLVIVMDDPKAYKRTVYDAVKLIKKNEKNLGQSIFKRFSFFELDSEITVKDQQISKDIREKLITVPELVVVGKQSYNKIAKLYQIAKNLETYDKKLCRQMYRAIGFIDRLITLPISQAELRDWIRDLTENWSESDANMLAKKYLWKSYKREWVQKNESSGHIASKDEFLSLCDELELLSSRTSEVSDMLINQLIIGRNEGGQKKLILVKERKISEFVNEMISDLITSDDDIKVAAYSTGVDISIYDDVYILGLNDRDLKDIIFTFSKGRKNTKVYITITSAFKIENELDVILDLESFEASHPFIQKIKKQISPMLDSIRHMGVPTEFSVEKSYEGSYDYDYAYTSFANIYLSNSQVFDVGKDTTILKYIKDDFYAITVESLEEGDWILPLDGFIEDVEAALGKSLPRASESSDLLKSYFQMARNSLSSKFVCKTRKVKVSKVFGVMQQIDPELCTEIHEGMVSRWIKHIEEFSNEDELSSNSAKKKKHFMLFAKAIGISDTLSNMFWEEGIKATRVNHIQAGKGISDTLKRILLKTMSGSELTLCESEVEKVLSLAKQRLSRVSMILLSEHSYMGQ